MQNSFTNIHFSVLKVIPLLMKEDILGKKKNVWSLARKWINKQKEKYKIL